ncbi:hypothetical protein SAMN05216464_104191 [Mucilaginibacter pineti]|uniref:Uncharacterized protein n=1 Tax=Mucilaginibacter pineti TaxID=1391627 RepID=A0A1G7ANM2_9SPHI|nr:hypothetical protein [Mucilaginibacter pineti]SDE16468.1 hypothetical protein SAMN05216464_104191 [Mucilaginibacter pineti]
MPGSIETDYVFFEALFWLLTIAIPIIICSYTFRWLYTSGYKTTAVIVPLVELLVMVTWYNSILL